MKTFHGKLMKVRISAERSLEDHNAACLKEDGNGENLGILFTWNCAWGSDKHSETAPRAKPKGVQWQNPRIEGLAVKFDRNVQLIKLLFDRISPF
jgi:hypothetical protein